MGNTINNTDKAGHISNSATMLVRGRAVTYNYVNDIYTQATSNDFLGVVCRGIQQGESGSFYKKESNRAVEIQVNGTVSKGDRLDINSLGEFVPTLGNGVAVALESGSGLIKGMLM